MDKFLETYSLAKINQEESENLNIQITLSGIETIKITLSGIETIKITLSGI